MDVSAGAGGVQAGSSSDGHVFPCDAGGWRSKLKMTVLVGSWACPYACVLPVCVHISSSHTGADSVGFGLMLLA